MSPVEKVVSAIIGGLFLVVISIIMVFQIQMNVNSRAISTIATRQTAQMNNIKSKIDQGYYDEAEDYMREANHEISKASTSQWYGGFYNEVDNSTNDSNEMKSGEGYGTQQNIMSSQSDYTAIKPVDPLGMPTKNNPFAYGQAYAIQNKQRFTWKTILTPGTEMNIYEGSTGVNRGHFDEGYIYRGSDEHFDRVTNGSNTGAGISNSGKSRTRSGN